jgi:signal transduction protein with GAF and PtsI domain
MNNREQYVKRTVIVDTTTGEVLDEKTQRLGRHYYQVQRADLRNKQREARRLPPRLYLTREARDLLVAGLLVTLMEIALWAMSRAA